MEATIEAPESSTTERTRAAIALSEILRDDLQGGQAAKRDAARLSDPRELDRELDETLAGLVMAAAGDESVFERFPRLMRLVYDMALERAEGLYRERSAGLRAAADAIVADAEERAADAPLPEDFEDVREVGPEPVAEARSVPPVLARASRAGWERGDD
ncbi:hypothetical protein LRS13_15870 [Svornostia abyssi]|uniref:Uncharacterized protein n=1 Tax=Svornostia abyssi TaxID=2898438 RepID=A0ABY5PCB8_9ACTN|nr:hypothetical protein LRS13_15870 [Parviterribacteraceae bacterium J379]